MPLFGAAAQTRPPMILVAAVDEQTRREVRRLADERGYAVQEAFDGVEAVEAALRLLPAAIVLDRVLPGCARTRWPTGCAPIPSPSASPSLVLAGEAELGDQARLFDGFIPKPLSKSALATAMAGSGPVPDPLDFAGVAGA